MPYTTEFLESKDRMQLNLMNLLTMLRYSRTNERYLAFDMVRMDLILAKKAIAANNLDTAKTHLETATIGMDLILE